MLILVCNRNDCILQMFLHFALIQISLKNMY